MNKSTIFIIFIAALGFLGINSLFTMNETQQGSCAPIWRT